MVKKFDELGLSSELLKSITEAGFTEPTEIQEKTIQLALEGKDIVGSAKTGSGKTLAFALPIIDKLEKGINSQALILVPTRELAQQVAEVLEIFSKNKGLRVAVVYGGVDIKHQIQSVSYSEIVVGTPGRILDHLERRTLELFNLKTLVLDEADRMLDMGFYEDVTEIVKQCPIKRQTLLFSATISPDIDYMTKKYMHNPVEIVAEAFVDASKLEQVYYDVPSYLKFSLLYHLLKEEKEGLAMIFCATRNNAEFVGKNLNLLGIEAVTIHGGFSQDKRNNIMEHFKSGKFYALVCTDVAARGLDIEEVTHVYNYDIPKVTEEYIHRVGRTARAGKNGKAISIVTDRDYDNFNQVLKGGELTIKRLELPRIEKVPLQWFPEGTVFKRGSGEYRGRGEGRGSGRFGSRGGGRREGGFNRGSRFGNKGSEHRHHKVTHGHSNSRFGSRR